MTNTEIWTGAGASVTFCPETDLFTGYLPGAALVTTVETGYEGLFAIELTGTHTSGNVTAGDEFHAKYQMVNDVYAGCIADFYTTSGLVGSHVIARNSENRLYFNADYSTLPGTNGYIIIRSYGTPIPAPYDSSGSPALGVALLTDNWLGLVNSVSFPTADVEMKQMNLALGGTRNWTHQYKGMETASGGNLDINANHGAWLYYALGKVSGVSATVIAGSASEGAENHFTAESAASDEFLIEDGAVGSQGPIFHRVIDATICPPILPSITSINDMDELTEPNDSSGDIAYPITYTFAEANGNDLPSFTLENTYAKSDASSQSSTPTGSGLHLSATASDVDEVFTRLATGNMVNTLTMTANENEELKMTLDLNTKQIVEPQNGYYSRRNISDERDFINFGSPKGGSANVVNHFLTPYFFSDGTISILGQSYLKITSMSLTINNNLTDKRYVGQYNKRVKNAVPGQREYELTLSGYVTDKAIWDALRNETEEGTNLIDLRFLKDNGEEIQLKFDDYFVTTNTWPIPDDKGAIQVDWTIKPRTLNTCTVKTHWVLQG